jgi:serine/threonine protein kinase
MSLPLNEFVKQLEETGVLASGTLKGFLPPQRNPKDADELARELVRQKRLTKFQSDMASRGHASQLVLGNYVLLEKIGAGGMGQVFKAQHRRMDRVVALKVLPPNVSKDKARVARFEREVKVASKLIHPNIVTAFDADQAGKVHFLVMEYVEGSDLAALVKKEGPLPIETSVNYILQAARGLEAAHAEGIVHRDMKPANLLVDRKGTVKVLDMGLARMNLADGTGGGDLTATGAVFGTVDYMAPEQALDTKQADARADVYSLGCTLFYLLTARATFDGDSLAAKLLAHQTQPVPPLRSVRKDVPERLDAVFLRMVARKVEDRYQSMTAVIGDLQSFSARIEARGASAADTPTVTFAAAEANAPTKKLAVVQKTWAVSFKALGAIFGTIIAPILVAFFLKWLDKSNALNTSPPNTRMVAVPNSPNSGGKNESEKPGLKDPPNGVATGAGPSTPKNDSTAPVTRLFNQQDLTGFYTFLGPPKNGAPPIGKGKDPNKVFTVKDGLLRISGQDDGVLLTAKDYHDYRLTVEFRWGQKIWPPREKKARDSGIALHCIGPDDGHVGKVPQSIQCQVREGCVGDLILIGANSKPPVSLSAETMNFAFRENNQDRSFFMYSPNNPLTTLSRGAVRRAGNLGDLKDEKGFHRADDVERPAGEWNVLECICHGDKIVVRLNDKVVNEASNVSPRKGRIGFMSEHAEILFKTINLQAIPPK